MSDSLIPKSIDDKEARKILDTAVSAIYFNDNSDYIRALYTIVDVFFDEDISSIDIDELFRKLNPE